MRRGTATDKYGNEFDVCEFPRESASPPATPMYAIRETRHVARGHGLANGWVMRPTFDAMFAGRVRWKDPEEAPCHWVDIPGAVDDVGQKIMLIPVDADPATYPTWEAKAIGYKLSDERREELARAIAAIDDGDVE